MSRVADKVVLITGAGSGIGRAAATLLAKEGATVIVTDVNKPGGLETVQQIGAPNSGGGARFLEQDTSKEADWKRIIGDILAREGKLNGLVNNAGISGPFPATFETETVEQWQRHVSPPALRKHEPLSLAILGHQRDAEADRVGRTRDARVPAGDDHASARSLPRAENRLGHV